VLSYCISQVCLHAAPYAAARTALPLHLLLLLLLPPQGTTTNGRFLLPFKTGAFLAGVPVLPTIIHYKTGGQGVLVWDSGSSVKGGGRGGVMVERVILGYVCFWPDRMTGAFLAGVPVLPTVIQHKTGRTPLVLLCPRGPGSCVHNKCVHTLLPRDGGRAGGGERPVLPTIIHYKTCRQTGTARGGSCVHHQCVHTLLPRARGGLVYTIDVCML
jgi:hypothetical protein